MEATLKVVILGYPQTGKTSLPSRFVEGVLNRQDHENNGLSIFPILFHVNGQDVTYRCWDLTPRTIDINPEVYLLSCDGVIIMADVTSANFFSQTRYWFNLVQRVHAGRIPVVLCGNKADANEIRTVSFRSAKAKGRALGIPYREISARANFCVLNPFKHLQETRHWHQMINPPALVPADIEMNDELKNAILRMIVGL